MKIVNVQQSDGSFKTELDREAKERLDKIYSSVMYYNRNLTALLASKAVANNDGDAFKVGALEEKIKFQLATLEGIRSVMITLFKGHNIGINTTPEGVVSSIRVDYYTIEVKAVGKGGREAA